MSNIEQELKILRADIQGLKAEISSINENLSAIEELLRLLLANQLIDNLDFKSPPKTKEIIQGRAEIIYGTGAAYLNGCYWSYVNVNSGSITRNCKFRILRNDENIFEGTEIDILAADCQTKVNSANAGHIYLISTKNYFDLQKNDVIESYILE